MTSLAAIALSVVASAASFNGAAIDAAAAPALASAANEAEAPTLLVVKFHADWCGKCRALSQPLADAKDQLAGEPVLFLELDFTDSTSSKQSEYLASIAGLGETWTEYERRTGFGLLVEPGTGTVLTMLGEPNADAIVKAVKNHL